MKTESWLSLLNVVVNIPGCINALLLWFKAIHICYNFLNRFLVLNGSSSYNILPISEPFLNSPQVPLQSFPGQSSLGSEFLPCLQSANSTQATLLRQQARLPDSIISLRRSRIPVHIVELAPTLAPIRMAEPWASQKEHATSIRRDRSAFLIKRQHWSCRTTTNIADTHEVDWHLSLLKCGQDCLNLHRCFCCARWEGYHHTHWDTCNDLDKVVCIGS
jgi:hypothetical protein